MTVDFRASQIETNKIISSGSTGTGAKILIYDIAADNASSPNQGNINLAAFNTSSIGTDILLYVSGTIATGSSTSRISAFGGSVIVSGSLGWQNNTYIVRDGNNLKFFDTNNGSGWTLTQLAAADTLQSAYNNGNIIEVSSSASKPVTLSGSTTGTGEILSIIHNSNAASQDMLVFRQLGSDTTPYYMRGFKSDGTEMYSVQQVGGFDTRINVKSQGSWNVGNGGGYGFTGVSDTAIGYEEPGGDTILYIMKGAPGSVRIGNNSSFFNEFYFRSSAPGDGYTIFSVPTWITGTFGVTGVANIRSGLMIHTSSITNIKTFGTDNYFYVSGTITSGSATDYISVFGGSVRISGVLAIGPGSTYITGSTIYTIDPTATGLTIQNYNVLDGTSLATGSRNITLTAGSTVVSGVGGSVAINAGSAGYSLNTGHNGGVIAFTCGNGGNNESAVNPAGAGGTLILEAGDGGANNGASNAIGGAGGQIAFIAGDGGNGLNGGGAGGSIELRGGLGIGVNSSGGNINLIPGYNQTNNTANGYVILNSDVASVTPNNDEFLIVSGTTDSTGSNTIRGVASFRGSIKTSGTLGFSNTIYFGKNGSDLIFFDDINTTGVSLSTLISSSNTTKGVVTTSDATPTLLWRLNLAANTLYDVDATIVATGTGSGITKRFKRNFAAMNFSSTGSILENTIFVPVLDVSGSAAVSGVSVGFIVSGTQVQAYATGSASQSIKWSLVATLVSQSNP